MLSHSQSIDISRQISVLEIRHRNMIDALLILGQQQRIGMGIDYIDRVAFEKKVDIHLRGVTVAEALNAITRPFEYRWLPDGRAIRITHRGAMVGNRNLLNTRIARFKVSKMPVELADCKVHGALYFALNPNSSGVLGDCPYGGIEHEVDGLEKKNATVRQILNALVSQHGNAAWVVQQPPWTMDKELGYGLWKMLAYDRPDGEYSRELQVRGLGLDNR